MFDEIILHHYPLSFFAEKIRRILAYKRVPWRSVEQPMMAPKPDLIALTGGYRRIPVLQIGADVYCDTACIARRLEQLRPEPACIPKDRAGEAAWIEDWADHRLPSRVVPPVMVELIPNLPPAALADRAAMSPLFTKEAWTAVAPHAVAQTLLALDQLDALVQSRRWVLGDGFSIADAACFHPLWFLQRSAKLGAAVAARPHLAAWFARIEAFGPGDAKAMSTAEALAVARDAEPADVDGGPIGRANGIAVGDTVEIAADDYAREKSCGVVVRWTPDEVAILREDPRVGEVAVHFPRAGYRIDKQ